MSALPESRLTPKTAARQIGPRLLALPRADRLAWAVVGLAVVAGVALRVASAQGDLWLDEIWSLNLVATATSPDQVFWAIPHDNNHPLNSLWLYLLGAGRPPVLYRLPAILFGGASIAVAAWIGFRSSRATGVAAALLAAFSYPLVNYGSEARGYAGLILAVLLGIAVLEGALADAGRSAPSRGSLALAAAVAFGTLSHFTMLAAVALFGLSAVLRLRWSGASWRVAFADTMALFRPTLIALWAIAAVVLTGVISRGGLTLGGSIPFTIGHFLTGLGGLTGLLVGLPSAVPLPLVFALLALFVAGALWSRLLAPGVRALSAGALAVPAAMALARLPNLEMPRYFLVSGVVLLVALAAAFGSAWRRGARWRFAAGALLAAALAGHAVLDIALVETGRGGYSAAAALMAQDGAATYASDADFRARMILDYVAQRSPAVPVLVPANDPKAFCRSPPGWYIHDGNADEPAPPARITAGPPACRMAFVQAALFPTTMLSGRQWTLFRRVP